MLKTKSGFTIVELLIVIVVIAILAAISIVAYNGIQNRANNSTVTADLRQTYSKLQLFKIDKGNFPLATSNDDINANFVTTRKVYGGGGNALIYCTNSTDAAIVGRSKSGMGYYHSSVNGSGEINPWPGDGNASLCPAAGIATTSTGYYSRWIYVNGTWESWFTVGN